MPVSIYIYILLQITTSEAPLIEEITVNRFMDLLVNALDYFCLCCFLANEIITSEAPLIEEITIAIH
ncbi:hypothetical protein T01_16032 [Trichinella spiralis]|uniref:Uncharacterized protein n=1 Tax=Trichinella spiralis TaxID=6334 RepID=A0A0V1ARB3_TRISP|nr:hypothetical protein T01_16032 [Trichinella spiralis]